MSGKWWGNAGAVGVPCADSEQYRRRVGSYTMKLLFQLDSFLTGITCSDEHFEFTPEAKLEIDRQNFVLLELLRTGEIRRRTGAEESDTGFQRFMARATSKGGARR